jgi:hypothetical protein
MGSSGQVMFPINSFLSFGGICYDQVKVGKVKVLAGFET